MRPSESDRGAAAPRPDEAASARVRSPRRETAAARARARQRFTPVHALSRTANGIPSFTSRPGESASATANRAVRYCFATGSRSRFSRLRCRPTSEPVRWNRSSCRSRSTCVTRSPTSSPPAAPGHRRHAEGATEILYLRGGHRCTTRNLRAGGGSASWRWRSAPHGADS